MALAQSFPCDPSRLFTPLLFLLNIGLEFGPESTGGSGTKKNWKEANQKGPTSLYAPRRLLNIALQPGSYNNRKKMMKKKPSRSGRYLLFCSVLFLLPRTFQTENWNWTNSKKMEFETPSLPAVPNHHPPPPRGILSSILAGNRHRTKQFFFRLAPFQLLRVARKTDGFSSFITPSLRHRDSNLTQS